jgi:hypothetical protein
MNDRYLRFWMHAFGAANGHSSVDFASRLADPNPSATHREEFGARTRALQGGAKARRTMLRQRCERASKAHCLLFNYQIH